MADTLLLMMFSWASKRGKHLLRTQNVSERNQKHFCVSDTNFVSATNVARAGKQGNICVRQNVSVTLCPRLPPPASFCVTASNILSKEIFSNNTKHRKLISKFR